MSTSANVPCEVVLVFACTFYPADYYRIIVIAYDYKCSRATFHVYVRMGSEPGTPLPPPPTHTHTHTHTLTNEPMKKTYESREKKRKKRRKKMKKGKKQNE